MRKKVKNLMFAFCGGVLAFSAVAQSVDETNVQALELRGNVKTIEINTFSGVVKFGEIEKDKKSALTFYEFNKAGYLLAEKNEYYKENGEVEDLNKEETKYDTRNRKVTVKTFESEHWKTTNLYYNSEGRLDYKDILDGDGKLFSKVKYKYSDGLLKDEVTYTKDGNIWRRYAYTYNEKRQMVRRQWYNENNTLWADVSYLYDGNGNQIEIAQAKTVLKDAQTTRYVYNSKNQKIEERNSSSGLDKKTIFEYNAQGDLVKTKNPEGLVETYTYVYDSNNNWIKCMNSIPLGRNDVMHLITERNIKYY